MSEGLYGNRAALLRAGVSRKDADSVAGGTLYSDYLPMRTAAKPRELYATVYSPSTWGMDYFYMGGIKRKEKRPKDYVEGFLMLLQPLSYFVAVGRVKSRSSKVRSKATFLIKTFSNTHISFF